MDAIAEAVEKERREKQGATQSKGKGYPPELAAITPPANRIEAERFAELSGKKLPNRPDDRKTATKLAESFGTNRTYVNQARKIKEAAPEIAEKVRPDKKLSSLNMTATGF